MIENLKELLRFSLSFPANSALLERLDKKDVYTLEEAGLVEASHLCKIWSLKSRYDRVAYPNFMHGIDESIASLSMYGDSLVTTVGVDFSEEFYLIFMNADRSWLIGIVRINNHFESISNKPDNMS